MKVYSSRLLLQSNRTSSYESIPLHPLIVESVSNPILLTRKIIPENRIITILDNEYNTTQLHEFFRTTLENKQCALKIDRELSMKKLKIIVKHGLNRLNKPGYSNLLDLFEKSGRIDLFEKPSKIEKLADNLLSVAYRYVGMLVCFYEQIICELV